MQIIRTATWVVLLIALLLFSVNNWTSVEVKIWEGLILETRLPALVILSFLLGLVPMWLLHLGARWRWNRRISALENTVKAVAPSPSTPVPAAPSANSENPA